MKKAIYILTTIIITTILAASTLIHRAPTISSDTPVAQALQQLGAPLPAHTIDPSITKASVQIGRNIVLNGFSSATPGKGPRQSKHFLCTSCHNVQQEDPDLAQPDPQARLMYAKENGLPFLQGTTLHGVVNRETWYNGDYAKKYGVEKIKPAQTDLREAIQLCATECAQGRKLKDWELESVLAYLWELQLNIGDLNLSTQDLDRINQQQNDPSQHAALRQLIRSKYSTAAPATFTDQPTDLKAGYGYTGDPKNGQLIYDLSCKHCHENGRYSMFILDDEKMTYRFMKRNFTKYTRYSTYHVTSYGHTTTGKRQYMPNYPLERMSQQQLEDLRAFFEEMSR